MQRYAGQILICFLSLSFAQAVDSQAYNDAQSEFESFKKAENIQFSQSKKEYQLYRQQLLSAFDQYKKQVSRIWGDMNTTEPNSTNWISYQNSLQHRSVVNFETGTIVVEIALDAEQNISASEVQTQLQRTVLRSLQAGADKRSILEIAKQPISQPSGSAVLRGLVARQDGSVANKSDYKALAAQSAKRAQKRRIKGSDGKKRIIYRTQLHLVPDHIKKRAQKYQPQIERHARKQKIPSALILAIMETESMFNPTARSPAPAFGLMQLVPTSGARDAYRHLYNKDRVVSDIYLYKPENNIKLGTAFLNRLYYGYLSSIKDPVSRQWATIAAYNTGAGNVYRSFAGKYRKARFGSRKKWKQLAITEINSMTSDEVYSFLRKRLPYEETRSYLHKVATRMEKYKSI